MGLGDGLMAKMTIKGQDYFQKLEKFGRDAPEIAKKIVMVGAAPVADQIRSNLKANLRGSEYSKGDLLDSLGIAPPDVDRNGNTNTKIGFDGYDKEGTPNQLKARAMESGTSKQKKKPFVRPAVKKTKEIAIRAMEKALDEELKKIGGV
jgi:HK97 gp10 family phage protein